MLIVLTVFCMVWCWFELFIDQLGCLVMKTKNSYFQWINFLYLWCCYMFNYSWSAIIYKEEILLISCFVINLCCYQVNHVEGLTRFNVHTLSWKSLVLPTMDQFYTILHGTCSIISCRFWFDKFRWRKWEVQFRTCF